MNYLNYDDVRAQLQSAGLILDGPLELAKGKKSVRCKVDGMGSEKRGWYRLYEWEMNPGEWMLVGSFGVFQGDDAGSQKIELSKRCDDCGHEMPIREKACPKCGGKKAKKRELSEEQKKALRDRVMEDRKRMEAEREAESHRAAQWAGAVWRASREAAPGEIEYLTRKHIAGTGGARIFESNDGVMLDGAEKEDYQYLAQFHGAMVFPMCDTRGMVFGVQFILSRELHKERIARTERDKEYWPAGMSKQGKYWLIGSAPTRLCLIAEGFATAMSLHEATGQTVAVAFDAGNLGEVARTLKKHYKNRPRLLICADDDWLQRCGECKKLTLSADPLCRNCGKPHGKSNGGIKRASEAALALDCAYVAPVFSAPRPEDRKGLTDFNDLHALEGIQAVRAQIEAKLAALKWVASDPVSGVAPSGAGISQQGGGDGASASEFHERRGAVSVLPLDEAIARFVPLDDGTGKHLFDTWTNKVALKDQLVALLPAGVRMDDVKRHPEWQRRGAFYLDQVGFDPSGNDRNVKLNTWKGWPLVPKEGSCDRLLELLAYLCNHEENRPDLFQWVLRWMAYPLQHPGAKMASAIILHGPQGTGKSTVFQTLAKIYGDYATVLNQRGLEDKFNADWSDSKLLIVAEEVVTRQEMWHIKNELKELVTGEWLRINPKNIAAYRQRNQINIIYLSNDKQPLPLENDDRRHCVIWTPQMLDESFYDDVFLELEHGGVEAFYHYLLNIDLGDFHPKKRPPMTEAKKSLILLSQPSELRFITEWINGDTEYPVSPCLAADLYASYLRWCRHNGESRPRPSNHFHGEIARMPGWEKKKCRVYTDCNFDGKAEPKPIVIPPLTVLQAVGRTMPEGAVQSEWLTGCIVEFSTAMSKGESKWAANG